MCHASSIETKVSQKVIFTLHIRLLQIPFMHAFRLLHLKTHFPIPLAWLASFGPWNLEIVYDFHLLYLTFKYKEFFEIFPHILSVLVTLELFVK
jgi:hypothetical protein